MQISGSTAGSAWRTITSNIWQRIPTATAGLEGVECPLKSRSYKRVGRRNRMYTEGSIRKSRG